MIQLWGWKSKESRLSYCWLYKHKWKYFSEQVIYWKDTLQVSIRPSFLCDPSLLSGSGSRAAAVMGRRRVAGVLWGINQLTGCHGGGWGSIHWCTGFLIKTSCTDCSVFERLIKLQLWSLKINPAPPAPDHTCIYMCKQTRIYKEMHVWKCTIEHVDSHWELHAAQIYDSGMLMQHKIQHNSPQQKPGFSSPEGSRGALMLLLENDAVF